jgi:bacterioferritin (cytochrome b1)
LNARLADELTAISQYMVHSEMCTNSTLTRRYLMSKGKDKKQKTDKKKPQQTIKEKRRSKREKGRKPLGS